MYLESFLPSELAEIFERAPRRTASVNIDSNAGKRVESGVSRRKSMEGCDCPICFMPFEPEGC